MNALEKSSIVKCGEAQLQMGGRYLQPICKSDPYLPLDELNKRLNRDGYLCLSGLLPSGTVRDARQVVLSQMLADGKLDRQSSFACPQGTGISYMGNKKVTHHPDFLSMVEHKNLFELFSNIFGEPAMTFDYKWARTVPEGAAGTQAHMDVVYMGRGSQRLMTCWIPVGDVPLENGPMVVLPGTHQNPAFEKIRQTYGRMDVDRDGVSGGWFSNNYIELSELAATPWVSGDFYAGDVVIMGITLMHGSIANQMNRLRLTVDTRFQPASESVDERWVGENPTAHQVWWDKSSRGECISIEQARSAWGV